MAKTVDFNLYAITDGGNDKDLINKVKASLDGGLRAIQLREKGLGGADLLTLAEKVSRITKDYKAKLFINDRADVARLIDADGLHLTSSSFKPSDARPLMGDDKLIAVSTHSLSDAMQAETDGADFITFGPIYETPSKMKYGAPLGLRALKEVTEAIKIPVFALGGIKEENISEVIDTGAYGIAMISTIFSSDNIKDATTNLITELRERIIEDDTP